MTALSSVHVAVSLDAHDVVITQGDGDSWLSFYRTRNLQNLLKNIYQIYFEINSDQTNRCVRWEAFKAYIRGVIISFTNYKKK